MSQSLLERSALEGESPVDQIERMDFRKSSVSWIGCTNTAELTANPKYKFKSDSVIVPRGKAEKNS